MNAKFKLYQSGIHRADVRFECGDVLVSERDILTLSFLPERKFSNDEITGIKEKFLIDLGYINSNSDKLKDILKTSPNSCELDGQVFERHQDYKNIYAAMKGTAPHDFLFMDGDIRGVIVSGRECVTVLVQESYEDFTPLKLWKQTQVSEAKYPISHIGKIMVPMRDGVKLAMEVWLPKGKAKCDTILVRTPYERLGNYFGYYKYVMRGYAVCIQDVRGRGDSEGEWIPKFHEREDGSDTLDFIAAQSWSTGNVGTIGGSYLGCVQWAMASSGNPHHKAIVSIVTSGDPFFDLPRKGGTLSSGVMAWAFSVKEQHFNKSFMQRDDWDKILEMRPIKDIPKKVFGSEIPFWTKWCEHETYDEFWRKCNWFEDRDKIASGKVPALIISGWYDDNGNATSQAIETVEGYPDDSRKVVLGPWMHNANSCREIHGVAFGTNAIRYDIDLLHLMWLDNKLSGIDNGVDSGSPVEFYLVGENSWVQSRNWPSENVARTEMFLSSKGRLEYSPEVNNAADEYEFDPLAPAPHLIDISENEICVPENYIEVDKRDDVLTYTSEPLNEDLKIAGDLTAEFYVSSTAPDTDFVVRLTDVDPDGNSIRLCDGLLRAKFREGFDKIKLLEPGKVKKIVIRTTKIANTFKAGHRIRLSITSGAENYIFPNNNTGNNFFEDCEYKKCKNKIHHGKDYPSKIFIPVLK